MTEMTTATDVLIYALPALRGLAWGLLITLTLCAVLHDWD